MLLLADLRNWGEAFIMSEKKMKERKLAQIGAAFAASRPPEAPNRTCSASSHCGVPGLALERRPWATKNAEKSCDRQQLVALPNAIVMHP